LKYGGNFRRMVVKAVNTLGTDTDTIGAMAAGLAGGLHGIGAVPEQWAQQMQDFVYLMRVGNAMAETSYGSVHGPAISFAEERNGKLPDVLDLVRSHRAAKSMRVAHRIFGPGTVNHVDAQGIRRRGGGDIMLATVTFDLGQTCKFKAYRPRVDTRTEAR
jgi:hypothetical protein